MKHQIREWGYSDRWPALTPTWQCSCGSEFSREDDAEEHAANANAAVTPAYNDGAWAFPSVTYDYDHERVGHTPRYIETDSEEVARVLQGFKTAAPPKVFP